MRRNYVTLVLFTVSFALLVGIVTSFYDIPVRCGGNCKWHSHAVWAVIYSTQCHRANFLSYPEHHVVIT